MGTDETRTEPGGDMPANRFDLDKLEIGWRAATAIWLENREVRPGFPSGPLGTRTGTTEGGR